MAARTLKNGTTTLPVGYERPDKSIRYWCRTDGKVLYQWRDSTGVLHPATILFNFRKEKVADPEWDLANAFKREVGRRGATKEVRQ